MLKKKRRRFMWHSLFGMEASAIYISLCYSRLNQKMWHSHAKKANCSFVMPHSEKPTKMDSIQPMALNPVFDFKKYLFCDMLNSLILYRIYLIFEKCQLSKSIFRDCRVWRWNHNSTCAWLKSRVSKGKFVDFKFWKTNKKNPYML